MIEGVGADIMTLHDDGSVTHVIYQIPRDWPIPSEWGEPSHSAYTPPNLVDAGLDIFQAHGGLIVEDELP